MLSDLSPEELQAKANELLWYHTIPLGRGVVTRGLSVIQWKKDHFPPLAGRTVLDIGAWDGGYSYLAEAEGATRVVALDHYAWGVDIGARDKYWAECAEKGVLPDHGLDTTEFWRDELPGRRGFDLAHEALGSKVETVVGDFTKMDLAPIGKFDVVLYLGVLYHMPEPLTCLERVRSVTNEVAVIETAAIDIPWREHERLVSFHGGNELGRDFGNWYVPSMDALRSMCIAAGFSKVKVVQGPPRLSDQRPEPPRSLADKVGGRLKRAGDALLHPPPPPAAIREYRALVHAYI